MTSAILWDNDGVLVDTEGLYFRATSETLAGVGVELTMELYQDVSLRQGQSTLGLAAANGASEADIARLRTARDRRYVELIEAGVRVLDRVEEALDALHGRVPMGIVTSSRRAHFDVIHRRTGLLRYFDFVLTREDYERTKPWPDAYLAALRTQRLHPDRCVVIEDTERGLRSATAAGLRCLVVPNALTAGGEFAGAHRVLSGAHEVPGEVEALLGV